jgi:hypothetical protein
LWVVEGLAGDRCALVTKMHEGLTRGRWGQGLLEAILSPTPEKEPEPGPAWLPRPRPSGRELLEASLRRGLGLPLTLARGAFAAAREPAAFRAAALRSVAALREAGAASESPINQPLGPHRRVDWLALDARSFADAAARSGASDEAVWIAVLGGALARFFERRGVPPAFQQGLRIRVALPDAEAPSDDAEGSALAWRVPELPLAEREPAARLRAASRALREAPQVGWELLARIAAGAPPLLSGFARRQLGDRLANLALTPFAGPPGPLFLLGARVLEMVSLLPLPPGQALRLSVLPYAGALSIGVSADWDLVPDLHDLVLACEQSFHELAAG